MLYSDTFRRFCFECRSSLKRLRREEGGATAIMTALALTVLVGFVGLGTEVGMWYAERRAMQTAADAAAMGGAYEIYKDGEDAPEDAVIAAAQADSKRNGFEDSVNGITVEVNRPPTSGEFADEDTAVETIVTKQRKTLLGSLFMSEQVNIKVRSVATVDVTGVYCILALADNEQGALTFSGTADVMLKNCGINVNSNNQTGALVATGASVVGATYADIVGKLNENGSAQLLIDDIEEGAKAVKDPYANLNVPEMACTYTDNPFKVNDKKNTTILYPGKYCGGLDIQSKAYMMPGNYIIAGDLSFGSQAVLTTDTVEGVTIFLTDNDDGDYGQFSMNAGANITITAAKSGAYMGIALFQDRNAPEIGTGNINNFNGGSNLNIMGAIYFPQQIIQFSGGNNTTGTCTRIVAFMITFTGESGLSTDCGYGFGTPQIYPPMLAE